MMEKIADNHVVATWQSDVTYWNLDGPGDLENADLKVGDRVFFDVQPRRPLIWRWLGLFLGPLPAERRWFVVTDSTESE